MGKSVAAPATIDYIGQAKAQGEANIDSARPSAKLSNPNINGPLGSQTVTYGTPSFDQSAYDKAMVDFQCWLDFPPKSVYKNILKKHNEKQELSSYFQLCF